MLLISILKSYVCVSLFPFAFLNTYNPTCIKQAPRGYSKSACSRQEHVNTGIFQCMFLFQEQNICLPNIGCLLFRGGY